MKSSIESAIIGAAMIIMSGAFVLADIAGGQIGLEAIPFVMLAGAGGFMVGRGWIHHLKEVKLSHVRKT